ncbi:helix-turn-helix transcriptional regulator [candidate division WWE3 bacterium]|nr:helix-turn-helix transcriptional regulator [candidate division WWE3 bacterium]
MNESPVNITVKVIGGKWKPIILWLLSQQKYRFSELRNEINGVTQKMLTQQLKELEKDGLIKRKVFPVVPPKVEYSLTPYGRSLQPLLAAMAEWGHRHTKRQKHR